MYGLRVFTTIFGFLVFLLGFMGARLGAAMGNSLIISGAIIIAGSLIAFAIAQAKK